ncbi:MAG TPA: hypothetical protein VFB60_11150 [Ktedonobacteraceae bacterium]|nr:hypothetical protein [Ktedonobacteraceae bacterium]
MDRYKEFFNKTQSMVSAGFIAFSLVVIQAFISIGKLELPALISVIAFAIAIPMLVFTYLLNELFSLSKDLTVTKGYRFVWLMALLSSIIGIIATFWSMSPFAGWAVLISGIIGLAVFINNDVRVKGHLIREEQTKD